MTNSSPDQIADLPLSLASEELLDLLMNAPKLDADIHFDEVLNALANVCLFRLDELSEMEIEHQEHRSTLTENEIQTLDRKKRTAKLIFDITELRIRQYDKLKELVGMLAYESQSDGSLLSKESGQTTKPRFSTLGAT